MPRRATVQSLQASINRLSHQEQQQLYNWLGKRLQENAMTGSESSSSTLATRNYDGKTYVPQKRRCGRAGCDCMGGEVADVGHGPYWYAYWSEDGKTQSQYIGKRPPWLGN